MSHLRYISAKVCDKVYVLLVNSCGKFHSQNLLTVLKKMCIKIGGIVIFVFPCTY